MAENILNDVQLKSRKDDCYLTCFNPNNNIIIPKAKAKSNDKFSSKSTFNKPGIIVTCSSKMKTIFTEDTSAICRNMSTSFIPKSSRYFHCNSNQIQYAEKTMTLTMTVKRVFKSHRVFTSTKLLKLKHIIFALLFLLQYCISPSFASSAETSGSGSTSPKSILENEDSLNIFLNKLAQFSMTKTEDIEKEGTESSILDSTTLFDNVVVNTGEDYSESSKQNHQNQDHDQDRINDGKNLREINLSDTSSSVENKCHGDCPIALPLQYQYSYVNNVKDFHPTVLPKWTAIMATKRPNTQNTQNTQNFQSSEEQPPSESNELIPQRKLINRKQQSTKQSPKNNNDNDYDDSQTRNKVKQLGPIRVFKYIHHPDELTTTTTMATTTTTKQPVTKSSQNDKSKSTDNSHDTVPKYSYSEEYENSEESPNYSEENKKSHETNQQSDKLQSAPTNMKKEIGKIQKITTTQKSDHKSSNSQSNAKTITPERSLIKKSFFSGETEQLQSKLNPNDTKLITNLNETILAADGFRPRRSPFRPQWHREKLYTHGQREALYQINPAPQLHPPPPGYSPLPKSTIIHLQSPKEPRNTHNPNPNPSLSKNNSPVPVPVVAIPVRVPSYSNNNINIASPPSQMDAESPEEQSSFRLPNFQHPFAKSRQKQKRPLDGRTAASGHGFRRPPSSSRHHPHHHHHRHGPQRGRGPVPSVIPPPRPIPVPRPRPIQMHISPSGRHNSHHSHSPRPLPPATIPYSYPKDAANIQDILSYFNAEENEIMENNGHNHDHGKSPLSSSSSGNFHSGMGGGGFSNELRDVQGSLLKDIREFAKRPTMLSDNNDNSNNINNNNNNSPPERDYSREQREREREKDSNPIPVPVPPPDENDSFQDHHDFDIFNPKPKPVRDLIKDKIRHQSLREREREQEREREREFSKEQSSSGSGHRGHYNHHHHHSPSPRSPPDNDFTKSKRHRHHSSSSHSLDNNNSPEEDKTKSYHKPSYKDRIEDEYSKEIENVQRPRHRDRELDRERERERESERERNSNRHHHSSNIHSKSNHNHQSHSHNNRHNSPYDINDNPDDNQDDTESDEGQYSNTNLQSSIGSNPFNSREQNRERNRNHRHQSHNNYSPSPSPSPSPSHHYTTHKFKSHRGNKSHRTRSKSPKRNRHRHKSNKFQYSESHLHQRYRQGTRERDKTESNSNNPAPQSPVNNMDTAYYMQRNRPIVIKRPYQPYRPVDVKKIEEERKNQDKYWNTVTTIDVKDNKGDATMIMPPPENIFSSPIPNQNQNQHQNQHHYQPQPQLGPSIPPPTLQKHYHYYGMGASPSFPTSPSISPVPQKNRLPPTTSTVRTNPISIRSQLNSNSNNSPEEEDILEIHTGSSLAPIEPPPHTTPHYQIDNHYERDKKARLQKMYMEYLQKRLEAQAEAQAEAMLPNTPHTVLPPPPPPPSKVKRPMRMKIHIYPNDNTHIVDNTKNPNLIYRSHPHPNAHPHAQAGGAPFISASTKKFYSPSVDVHRSGASYGHFPMHNNPHQTMIHSVPAGIAPPTIQQHIIPATNLHHSPRHGAQTGVDKNKNVVLHLHVHRRNGVEDGQMEMAGSETVTSTVKPLTYEDIYESSNSDIVHMPDLKIPREQQQLNIEDEQEIEAMEISTEHPPEVNQIQVQIQPSKQKQHKTQTQTLDVVDSDKSLSVELPIHQDKIDDVLSTLLKLRN